jgi:hypothetical protein
MESVNDGCGKVELNNNQPRKKSKEIESSVMKLAMAGSFCNLYICVNLLQRLFRVRLWDVKVVKDIV